MRLSPREIRNALDKGAGGGSLFRDARDPGRWLAIKDDPQLQALLREMADEAGRLLETPLTALPYSLFKLFSETGSRREYEREVFARRSRLCLLAVLALAHGDRRYLEALEDVIWAICDEFTWCLPAHLGNTCPGGREEEGRDKALDLFATDMGFTLAEIMSLLTGAGQPGLAPQVAARARREVFRRVLEPYAGLSQPLWWENAPMNWAAVCAGSIGAAAMYLVEDADQLALLLHRVLRAISVYLEGFGADGACLEGPSYWAYGFGYFTYFAALLYERTGGALDLFADDKIEQIALFPQRCRLSGEYVVSFSDTPLTVNYPPGLLAYLQARFGGLRIRGPLQACLANDTGLIRWTHTIRNLVWGLPRASAEQPEETSVYFPEAQWLIARGNSGAGPICIAAKGGRNDEPHNHNDIGSFIIHINGETFLTDPGRHEYNRRYFGPERYEFFTASSRGHSVPIVDGRYQEEGGEHAARIVESRISSARDELVMEMAPAYGDPNLKSLIRSFTFHKGDDSHLILEDTFVFAQPPTSLIERFISFQEPMVLPDGRVCLAGRCGRVEIEYPRGEMRLETGKETFPIQEGGQRTVYLIDLIHDRPARRLSVLVKFFLGGTEVGPGPEYG